MSGILDTIIPQLKFIKLKSGEELISKIYSIPGNYKKEIILDHPMIFRMMVTPDGERSVGLFPWISPMITNQQIFALSTKDILITNPNVRKQWSDVYDRLVKMITDDIEQSDEPFDEVHSGLDEDDMLGFDDEDEDLEESEPTQEKVDQKEPTETSKIKDTKKMSKEDVERLMNIKKTKTTH